MLKIDEIKAFINDDSASKKKQDAAKGVDYYEGRHDIRYARFFYFTADGILKEDFTRSNVRIPHTFFTELVDQAVQYILSGNEFVKAYDATLQAELDKYFGKNEDFAAELSEVAAGSMIKGFEYMYAYKNTDDRLAFQCADSLGVVEVRAKDTDDNCDHIIYRYVDRVDKGKKHINRIQVWDYKQVYYYVQEDDGEIILDVTEEFNPKPHIIFTEGNDESNTFFEGFGFIPFFRLDSNKKQFSHLNMVKEIIDDYDIMASSLSNNLIDFDTPLHVVKGYEGDNLDELQLNLKTKKMISVDSDNGSGVDVETVNIPYEARMAKLQLDEKGIYHFGMGLNISGLKDTSATTNIAIKAAYSLLDLKCFKFETKLKQFMRKILKVVIAEINYNNGTAYKVESVDIKFDHEIMTNALENAQIALTEAQEQQTRITTLLNVESVLDDDTVIKNICDILEIEYDNIKDKLPNPYDNMAEALAKLEGENSEGVVVGE